MAIAAIAGASLVIAALGRIGLTEHGPGAEPAGNMDSPDIPLRKLKRCEAVLRRRLQNVVVVLERSSSTRHYEAVCRTCECLGVQNVWCLEHPPPQQLEKCETEQDLALLEDSFQLPNAGKGIFKKARKFLTVRRFKHSSDFLATCESENLEVWCAHSLARDEYNFDYVGAYGCEDVIRGMSRVQDLGPRDVPRRVALVFCMDENGFSREVIRRSSRHLTYGTGSGVSLDISVGAALVIHRVIHLKRQKRDGLRDRIVDLATGRGREDFKYVYSFPEGKLDRMHRGDLDGKALVQLRERWFRILAKTEYRHEEYKKYIRRPLEPFGDLRPPDQFRQGRICPRIKKRNAAREQQAGFVSAT